MKKRTAFFAMMMWLSALPAFAAPREGIAVVVNDSVISVSDVVNRERLYLSAEKAPLSEGQRQLVTQQVIARLVDEALQMQEARTLGIAVPEEDVNAAFASIAKNNGAPSADAFRKKITGNGISVETLYDQIRAELAWAQVVRRKIRPQVNISDSEIDTMMTQITKGQGKNQYRVAEIFVRVATAKKEKEILGELEKILTRLKKGEPFPMLARQYSQAPGAASGGDLGWVQEGQVAPEINAELEKMTPGQISPPVRTEAGYHILFLRDLRQSATPSAGIDPASLQPRTLVHLKQILIPTATNDPDPVISAKFTRALRLKDEIADCTAMDAALKDFPSPATGDIGKVSLEDLPPPVKTAIKDLPEGTLSAPIRNAHGVAVVMVCGRAEAAPETAGAPLPKFSAPLPENAADRTEVANTIGRQRMERMAERYLRDLRAAAFIEKRI